MRILHIGPVTSVHTQIAALAYTALGYEVTFLNTRKDAHFPSVPGVPAATDVVNPWAGLAPIVPGARRGSSLGSSLVRTARYLGARDRALDRALSKLAGAGTYDVVVGTWGLPVLEAMLAAQRAFPAAAFVYNVLTAPELPLEGTGLKTMLWRGYLKVADAVERSAYGRMLRACDVRVHASEHMREFLVRRYDLGETGKDVVRLERFSRAFFPTRRLPRLSGTQHEPHIIHLGATNFSGLGVDNLRRQFERLTDAGIHVHFATRQNDAGKPMASGYYHRFPAIGGDTVGSELADFATQFDAAVILFNVEREYARFRNALPTRFLFALTVGIPVVLPRGIFPSCQEYVERHDIGLAYGSERELAEALSDRARMDRLRAKALSHSQGLSVEDNLDEYRAIFYDAMYIRDVRAGTAPAVRS